MQGTRWPDTGQPVAPMLSVRVDAPIDDERWVYEPKYDGRRALVAVEPGVGRHGVHIWSPRGRDETARYPDIVRALANLARRLKAAVVLDGAIVAVEAGRSAFVAFDVLRDGDEDLRPLDYLQNSRGKTLATAYSARASSHASVSTPLTWEEVDAGVDRAEFTIRTIPARVATRGDLWAALRASPGADLGAIVERAERKPA